MSLLNFPYGGKGISDAIPNFDFCLGLSCPRLLNASLPATAADWRKNSIFNGQRGRYFQLGARGHFGSWSGTSYKGSQRTNSGLLDAEKLAPGLLTLVRIHPATGVTQSGKTVSGYYPELTGSGTLIIRGPRFDNKLYKILIEKMEVFAPKVTVKNLRRSEYRLTREQWRLTKSPPSKRDGAGTVKDAAPTTGKGSVEERLKALENLKTANKITDTEYGDLRAKILKDL